MSKNVIDNSPVLLSKYKRKLLTRAHEDWEALRQDHRFDSLVSSAKTDSDLLPLLLDECVRGSAQELMAASGLQILRIGELDLRGASDEQLVQMAIRHQFGIFTHDKGFSDPARHNLAAVPAIVIVPADNYQNGKLYDLAVQAFCGNFRLQAQAPGRVLAFCKDGTLKDYQFSPLTADRIALDPKVRHVDFLRLASQCQAVRPPVQGAGTKASVRSL